MDHHDLITQARTWVGTPFHHQGRLKNIGCDCLGMVIGVADELGITHEGKPIAALDNTNYSREPNTAELLTKMEATMQRVTDMQVGDIALLHISGNPQHLGIITDYIWGGFGILHALNGHGVVEHALNDGWKKRIYRLYRFNLITE